MSDINDYFIEGTNFANISTPKLEGNPNFRFLRSELKNEYVKSRRLSPVFKSLHNLLTEATFTENKDLQDDFLLKIRSWYEKKTLKFSKIMTPETKKPMQIRLFQKREKDDKNNVKARRIRLKVKHKTIFSPQSKNKASLSQMTDTFNRPATSSCHQTFNRQTTQTPSIIKSILNNFVKNKRGKMYNFTLQTFLDEAKQNLDPRKTEGAKERPMSSSMKRQLEEVERVKNKLANKKVHCHVNSLYEGIVINDNHSTTPLLLPKGGELLIRRKS